MRKLLFILFSLLAFNMAIFAQVEDSTEVDWDEDDDKEWDWGWNWKWDKNWVNQEFSGSPIIEATYGFGNPYHKKLNNDPAKIGVAELKLGYTYSSEFQRKGLVEFSDKYFFVSNISNEIYSSKLGTMEIGTDMWRFGFAKRKGYGYELGSTRILPYSTEGISWSRIKFDYPYRAWPAIFPPLPGQVMEMEDVEIINRYEENFRFGTLNETGVRFEIANTLSINAGYEAAVIFPRWMFWKHMGSLIIESAANGILDKFINKISDSSPAAAPIVNFVLKNGISYAFYTLKKDKMNWPFSTETPLTYETFKLGVTFTF
ncbi:MAG: hypothetical protein KF816_16330 [Melioribacteraceae bacterium]|nr:hypothetical protein [Melioribacteraceae bacterium]